MSSLHIGELSNTATLVLLPVVPLVTRLQISSAECEIANILKEYGKNIEYYQVATITPTLLNKVLTVSTKLKSITVSNAAVLHASMKSLKLPCLKCIKVEVFNNDTCIVNLLKLVPIVTPTMEVLTLRMCKSALKLLPRISHLKSLVMTCIEPEKCVMEYMSAITAIPLLQVLITNIPLRCEQIELITKVLLKLQVFKVNVRMAIEVTDVQQQKKFVNILNTIKSLKMLLVEGDALDFLQAVRTTIAYNVQIS